VGTILDTTVFIDLERHARRRQRGDVGALIAEHLADVLEPNEEIAIATITASELLHGVHRATPEHRPRREAFVEAILSAIPALPFDLLTARAHSRIWAELTATGKEVGPHDRLVAATAISTGWQVATANLRDFNRVPGLRVIEIGPTGR